jgi:hypothetical protein
MAAALFAMIGVACPAASRRASVPAWFSLTIVLKFSARMTYSDRDAAEAISSGIIDWIFYAADPAG